MAGANSCPRCQGGGRAAYGNAPEPANALSRGFNTMPLDKVEGLRVEPIAIHGAFANP